MQQCFRGHFRGHFSSILIFICYVFGDGSPVFLFGDISQVFGVFGDGSQVFLVFGDGSQVSCFWACLGKQNPCVLQHGNL
jgi:hypothetical protein